MKQLKLEIELVPATSWFTNLRQMISKENWDIIRKQAYAKYNHRCGICGQTGMLHAHEIWSYNDEEHIQKLVGIIALCVPCHHIKHIGLASILANEGKLDYQEAINHFCQVNNCSQSTFVEHKRQALILWEERSKYQWKVDLGALQTYASI